MTPKGAFTKILIAGRDLAKAQAFCTHPSCTPVPADRATMADTLATYRPDILIDASGPFHDCGPVPYTVLQACIASGTNHIDFVNGADFVAGTGAFGTQAKAAQIFALSGASAFPVLTAAVLREMAKP